MSNNQEGIWSANSFRLAVGFGFIGAQLAYIQIKLQTSLFHDAPILMHASLVAGAVATLSSFHLTTIQDPKLLVMLRYVAGISGSLWIVLLMLVVSQILGWSLLVLWIIGTALTAKKLYKSLPLDQEGVWSVYSFRLAVGFGFIGAQLVYIQIKLQTSLFHDAPILMHASLVAGAVTTLSSFHLTTVQDPKLLVMLRYVAGISGSLWIVLLMLAVSQILGWSLLVLWIIGTALAAKKLYTSLKEFCARLGSDEGTVNEDPQPEEQV